jgi:sulfite exporter TauE/SafE
VGAAVAATGADSQGALATPTQLNVVKRRNVLAVWLGLPLITLGLYHWYWYPTINRELRDSNPRIQVTPFVAWLALVPGVILILPPFISMYNTGKRIATAQADAGIGASCSPVIGVLLMVVFGLNTLYYQSELNKLASRR